MIRDSNLRSLAETTIHHFAATEQSGIFEYLLVSNTWKKKNYATKSYSILINGSFAWDGEKWHLKKLVFKNFKWTDQFSFLLKNSKMFSVLLDEILKELLFYKLLTTKKVNLPYLAVYIFLLWRTEIFPRQFILLHFCSIYRRRFTASSPKRLVTCCICYYKVNNPKIIKKRNYYL